MNSKAFILLAIIASLFLIASASYEEISYNYQDSQELSSFEEFSVDDHEAAASLQYDMSLTSSAVQLSAAGFAYIRANLFGGKLTNTQVANINAIMAACNKHGVSDVRQVAYLFATTKHETANAMTPVREAFWLSEAWRKSHLRYYPYYGRGYVQLTWLANYQKADRKLGLGGRLVKNLDLAMTSAVAAPVLVVGCKEGWFTGRKLGDYINSKTDYYNARRIVNGLDKASLIAGYAKTFETALRKR